MNLDLRRAVLVAVVLLLGVAGTAGQASACCDDGVPHDARTDGVTSAVAAGSTQAGVATKAGAPAIKAGSAGGETAGKAFPRSVRGAALEENPSTCVYYRMETDAPQVDHAIPRARGGNATLDNAQTTCPWCNASKGARDFPVNPPPGYRGPWPPPWWWTP
jgi:hypothetical protein